MKTLFFGSLLGLVAFELLNVFFIMPFPGSQGGGTLALAYGLHQYRWVVRALLVLAIAAGVAATLRGRVSRWLAVPAALLAGGAAWMLNFQMSADAMFQQPATLSFAGGAANTVDAEALVLGVAQGGEAKAYPIRYLAYHHQVRDTLGGKPIMVTYCSVCRSGRVFEPVVDGAAAQFRLVGMDRFNAMFEDAGTRTWWRQATGEAVAGPLAGRALPVVDALQVSVREWLALHPHGVVMQADPAFVASYDGAGRYERGESTGALTRTDRGSWTEKAWVVGIELGGEARAYDWNRLVSERVINDTLAGRPIAVVLAADGTSFGAYERADATPWSGQDLAAAARALKPIAAYQEFWHSWRTFHPETGRY